LEKLIQQQIKGGVDGFVVNGTTAESPNLDKQEVKQIFDFIRTKVPKGFPLILGSGTNSTKNSIQFSKECESWGADALLLVVPYYNKPNQKGLVFAATPASDFICGTLQLAAGMNLHVFTTGRGTPYGLAEVPVIKVATRTDLAKRWHDLMDINAGTIADGHQSIEDVGWELFHVLLEVASGRKKTWAEHWKLKNALVLFNPAPVT
jgi:hypothetical protein